MPLPLSVLLVDDNAMDRLLAAEAFESLGCSTALQHCASGTEALTFLRDHARPLPHVLLLDLNMPGMTGLQVLEVIRKDARLRHLPVVILSTSAAEQDIAQAYELFANAYLVKQAQFTAFVEQMRRFVQYWGDCHVVQSRSFSHA